jgi:hypothetical protein
MNPPTLQVLFDVARGICAVRAGGAEAPHTAEDADEDADEERRVLDAIGEIAARPAAFAADDVSPVRLSAVPSPAMEVHTILLEPGQDPFVAVNRLRIAREVRIARLLRERLPAGRPDGLTTDAILALDAWMPILAGSAPSSMRGVGRIHISEARHKDGDRFPYVWAGPPIVFRRGITMRTLRYAGPMADCSVAHGYMARAYGEGDARRIAVAMADADEILDTEGAAVLQDR